MNNFIDCMLLTKNDMDKDVKKKNNFEYVFKFLACLYFNFRGSDEKEDKMMIKMMKIY